MTERSRAFAAAALSSVLFSAHYVAARRVLVDVGPLALAAMRGMVGGALLLAIAPRMQRRVLVRLLPIAALGFGLNQVCFMFGLQRSTPTEAALLSQGIPLFAALAGLAILREKPTRSAWTGLALGFVALATYFALRFELRLTDHLVGNALVVLNVVCFAASLALARRMLQDQPAALVTGGMLFLGGAALAAIGYEQLGAFFARGWPSGELALLLAFELVISTACAWLASMYAVKHLKMSESSIFVYAQVPLTALLSLATGGQIGWSEIALCPAVVLAAHLVRRQPTA